jgi:hypothetical protein
LYTRFDRDSIYRDDELCHEQGFETYDDADAHLELSDRQGGSPRKYNGWMGPIPIVDLSKGSEAPFLGPRLEQRLRFPDTDGEETFDEFFESFWQDDAVDQIPRVMSELERKGEIPGVPASDCWGPPILTPDDHKRVQKAIRPLRLPDIELFGLSGGSASQSGARWLRGVFFLSCFGLCSPHLWIQTKLGPVAVGLRNVSNGV